MLPQYWKGVVMSAKSPSPSHFPVGDFQRQCLGSSAMAEQLYSETLVSWTELFLCWASGPHERAAPSTSSGEAAPSSCAFASVVFRSTITNPHCG